MELLIDKYKVTCKKCNNEAVLKSEITITSKEEVVFLSSKGVLKVGLDEDDFRLSYYDRLKTKYICSICGESGYSIEDITTARKYQELHSSYYDYFEAENNGDFPHPYIIKSKGKNVIMSIHGRNKRKDRSYITALFIKMDVTEDIYEKYGLRDRDYGRCAEVHIDPKKYEFYSFNVPIVNKKTTPYDKKKGWDNSVYYCLEDNMWKLCGALGILGEMILDASDCSELVKELNKRNISRTEFLNMIIEHNKK